jgi:hypothetical protein
VLRNSAWSRVISLDSEGYRVKGVEYLGVGFVGFRGLGFRVSWFEV